ncbi:hypothetical protein KFK09_022709 [Dendrobium nobile]|uniref:Endonuclease/exonuclease/phosphatase domain-containing protein n=1 Tax=Dendrobium nobile TaxID=94219 RepID=A0A8T3AJG7_DENNO|nr:hypothetical protein KFK09_022709 [Dendrobium nobile]
MASSSKRQKVLAKKPNRNASENFLSKANEESFPRFASAKITPSRILIQSEIHFKVMHLFASTQFHFILSLIHFYNKQTFHYFLANMSFNSDHSCISSFVFKQKVEITKHDIGAFLNLRTEGYRAHTLMTETTFKWYDVNRVIRQNGLDYHVARVSSMTKNARIIQHILRSSIIPKAGDRINIIPLLSVLTFLIIECHPIDEAQLIIDHIYGLSEIGHADQKRKRNISLGHLVTYILEKKYNLVHPDEEYEEPVYYNDASFRLLFKEEKEKEKAHASASEEVEEGVQTSAPQSDYQNLIERFDRLETHVDQRFDQFDAQLKQQQQDIDKVFIPAQEEALQIEKEQDQRIEELVREELVVTQPDLSQVIVPNSVVPTLNKFGILSELEDNNLNGLVEEKDSSDVEEGEIVELEKDVSKNLKDQELKITSDDSSKVASCEVKEVEISSSGKKGKLHKELKSLGSDFWNCRGPKKREATQYLKEFVKDIDVLFVGLVETKVSSMDNLQILNYLGDKWESYMVPSEALSGGILVLWRKVLASFIVLDVSSQLITGSLEVIKREGWLVSTVYGSRNTVERKSLWENLEKLYAVKKLAIIGGDFNCILSQEEKRGGKKFVFSQGIKDMKMFMSNNDFHEIGFIGPKFTWCNNKSGGGRILKRLDRYLMNSNAMNSIQLALVKHLSCIASDHCQIILEVFKPVNSNYKDIHFEDVWASFHGATAIVEKSWKKFGGSDPASSLNLKFKRTLKALFYWSKARFNSLNALRDSLKKEIFDLQFEEVEGMLNETKLLILRSKVNELNCTLARLNFWWRQRAKVRWMEEGDANSAFFHSFANARMSSN